MVKVRVWATSGEKYVTIYMGDQKLIPYFMSGRVVFLYSISKDLKCVDCGRQAKYVVIDPKQGLNWAWCGICDVGG